MNISRNFRRDANQEDALSLSRTTRLELDKQISRVMFHDFLPCDDSRVRDANFGRRRSDFSFSAKITRGISRSLYSRRWILRPEAATNHLSRYFLLPRVSDVAGRYRKGRVTRDVRTAHVQPEKEEDASSYYIREDRLALSPFDSIYDQGQIS